MAARAAGEAAAWARRLSRLVTTCRLFFTRWWTSRSSASFWPSEALSSSSRAPSSPVVRASTAASWRSSEGAPLSDGQAAGRPAA